MDLKKERSEAMRSFTKEAIRQAVLTVMGRYGEPGITMSRVAKEAGVAKGTLYLYYTNKEELLKDTIDWCVAPLLEGAGKIIDTDQEPDEKIIQLISFHHGFFKEHQQLFKMLLVDQQYTRSHKKRQENEQYHIFQQKVSDLIQEGIDGGMFKPVNPMIAAVILMESSTALTYEYLKPENDFDSAQSADILKEIFLKGILNNE